MADPVRQNDILPMDIPDAVRPDRPRLRDTAKSDIPLSIDDRAAFVSPASSIISPARRMQETLGREFAEVELDGKPWSQRRTIAFVALTCGAFWTCVYFLIAALMG